MNYPLNEPSLWTSIPAGAAASVVSVAGPIFLWEKEEKRW